MVESAFAAGEGEEGFDQRSWSRLEASSSSAGRSPHLRGGGIAEGDLHQCALSGEGGSELVGGVGDEATLRLEGGVEAPEEVVEGVAELLELVLRAVEGEALVQAGRGDPAGGAGDRSDGRSILPAMSQPARRARTPTTARAIPESTRSWCESEARCAACAGPRLCHLVHGLCQLVGTPAPADAGPVSADAGSCVSCGDRQQRQPIRPIRAEVQQRTADAVPASS